jgi:hypothetical protein
MQTKFKVITKQSQLKTIHKTRSNNLGNSLPVSLHYLMLPMILGMLVQLGIPKQRQANTYDSNNSIKTIAIKKNTKNTSTF